MIWRTRSWRCCHYSYQSGGRLNVLSPPFSLAPYQLRALRLNPHDILRATTDSIRRG